MISAFLKLHLMEQHQFSRAGAVQSFAQANSASTNVECCSSLDTKAANMHFSRSNEQELISQSWFLRDTLGMGSKKNVDSQV
jgi:hypothetical protein